MRRPPSIALAAVLAAALAACGNERQSAPSFARAAPPVGLRTVELPDVGIRFVRPANWRFGQPVAPHVAAVSSGEVAINVWRYRRSERLPRSAGDLQRARRALVAAARARDRTLRVFRARPVRVAGVPAVEVVASQRIGIARRTVRSTHLYAHGGEVVVDAYAPPPEFARVDRTVFAPLLRSLRLERPAPRRRP